MYIHIYRYVCIQGAGHYPRPDLGDQIRGQLVFARSRVPGRLLTVARPTTLCGKTTVHVRTLEIGLGRLLAPGAMRRPIATSDLGKGLGVYIRS